jgi:NAD(P)-dependent dehydrogenase (short-subunit alcohol dehydrogenase family)
MAHTSALFSVAGLRVVVTGGTAGIGAGVAGHLASEGAQVVITGRRATGPDTAATMGCRFVSMDVADDGSVRDGLRAAADWLGGGLDVLILNAGIDLEVGELAVANLDAFRQVLDVNVMGVARGLRFGAELLADGSSVIVTSSPAGRVPMPGLGAYAASKAALDVLTRTAALELAARRIRVNAVLPGIVATEMLGGATGDGEWLTDLTAQGLMREPEHLAGVFQFLASAASAPD